MSPDKAYIKREKKKQQQQQQQQQQKLNSNYSSDAA